jgi:hypothetical protein
VLLVLQMPWAWSDQIAQVRCLSLSMAFDLFRLFRESELMTFRGFEINQFISFSVLRVRRFVALEL